MSGSLTIIYYFLKFTEKKFVVFLEYFLENIFDHNFVKIISFADFPNSFPIQFTHFIHRLKLGSIAEFKNSHFTFIFRES